MERKNISFASRALNFFGSIFIGRPAAIGMPSDFYYLETDRDMPTPEEAQDWQTMCQRLYVDTVRRKITNFILKSGLLLMVIFAVIAYGLSLGGKAVDSMKQAYHQHAIEKANWRAFKKLSTNAETDFAALVAAKKALPANINPDDPAQANNPQVKDFIAKRGQMQFDFGGFTYSIKEFVTKQDKSRMEDALDVVKDMDKDMQDGYKTLPGVGFSMNELMKRLQFDIDMVGKSQEERYQESVKHHIKGLND